MTGKAKPAENNEENRMGCQGSCRLFINHHPGADEKLSVSVFDGLRHAVGIDKETVARGELEAVFPEAYYMPSIYRQNEVAATIRLRIKPRK